MFLKYQSSAHICTGVSCFDSLHEHSSVCVASFAHIVVYFSLISRTLGERLGDLSSREPLLYAASEHCEVGVPLNMLHSRVNARGHVPTTVQRLQPKRIVPVELAVGEKKSRYRGDTVYHRSRFDRVPMEYKHEFATYPLIPHFYNVFVAVIESKVAV